MSAPLLNLRTPLIDRHEIGLAPPRSTASSDPTEGTIDHWLGPGAWSPSTINDHGRCAPMLRSIQRYHMQVQGWSDIAYNFAVCPHGVAYTLRGFNRNGANGTAYWNRHTYTVLWMVGQGDPFELVRDAMTVAAADVRDWCRWVGGGGAAPTRRGHSDVRTTACPGPEILSIVRADWTPPPVAPPVALSDVVAGARTPDRNGYWMVDTAGTVTAFGTADHFGDLTGIALSAPIVGIAPTLDGDGYWLAGADGGVFTFGKARFYGSMGATPINRPIVAIEGDTAGYTLFAADGGVFCFGSARFHGSRA